MKEIIVDIAVEEKRVALLEDGELVEFYIERPGNERLVGNIYRGKVCSVLPGMQAAFVDIGYEKNAFLYVGDAISPDEDDEIFGNVKQYSIEELLRPGQEITVQVVKEPIESKGPRVTTQVTLPGRHLVLLPDADYIGVSRRIQNNGERNRLKKCAEAVKPKNMGLIVRTASEGKSLEDFKSDISFLMKHWKEIKRRERKGQVPRCLHKDLNLVYKTVRDLFTPDMDRFVVNDRKEYENVKELVDMISPALKNRVTLYNKEYHIFQFYNIESKINRALARKVWLDCGGYLIFDRTEALTVIDVNTGKYVGRNNLEDTVVKTNIEAAKEIAKQLRLRDIGGIIVIDFIDMSSPEHQKKVMERLRQELKKDRTKSIVVGMTGLGLIEMTRKKVRQGLNSYMTAQCPYCNGTGKIPSPESVARNVEKEISEFVYSIAAKNAIQVEVHPSVALILESNNGRNLKAMQKNCNKKIILKANEEFDRDEIKIKEIDINSLVC